MINTIEKYSKVIAEINLNNLDFNLRQIQNQVAPAQVIAVVKADAYGHGLMEISKRLEKNGIEFLAVARIKEALQLIDGKINGNILVFGRLNIEEIKKAIELNIRITLTNINDLDGIENCAEKLNKKAIIHINFDTGMGRVGVFQKNLNQLIEKLKISKNIKIEGIYSHFSTSDTKDKTFATEQYEKFQNIIDEFQNKKIKISMIHMANSGGILDIPEVYQNKFNAVRAGIMLYGCYPSVETSESVDIKPVMTLKTHILEIRELDANQPVSYGLRYYTKEKTRIAVLPIGYADGISRIFTNKGKVLIQDRFFPIVGTVTMDQIMVAVDENIKEGDEVIFWGNSEKQILKPSEIADEVGTISYELCTSITNRVLKKYIEK